MSQVWFVVRGSAATAMLCPVRSGTTKPSAASWVPMIGAVRRRLVTGLTLGAVMGE